VQEIRKLPGVGIEIDIDLATCSDEELREFGKKIPQEGFVLVRNQNLHESQIVSVCESIGRLSKPDLYCMNQDYPGLFQVTNEVRDGKKIGVFTDKELDWHSNGNGRPTGRESCVGLYCVKPGINSVTSVCDLRSAYADLSEDLREIINNVDCLFKFKNGTFYQFDEDDELLSIFEGHSDNEGVIKNLVFDHPWTGEKVIYFAFHTIREMWRRDGEDLSEDWLRETLLEHILKEKYIYHHDNWREGDFLFMDQFHTIHKRNAVEGERFLYRTCFDYENLTDIQVQ